MNRSDSVSKYKLNTNSNISETDFKKYILKGISIYNSFSCSCCTRGSQRRKIKYN